VDCSRGISELQEEFLKIVIPEWLAGMLRIEEGDLVCVDNNDGKFHIIPSKPRAVH
jgi:antitoxin component of MazEF toxin-antitoxin module